MKVSITITQPNAPPAENLYRILRDYEIYGEPRPVVIANNRGYPHTQPTYEKLKLVTTKEYQLWWRDLIRYFAPTDELKIKADRIFQRLTDGGLAWCNKEGSDTNADFVNGTHLDKEPIKQEMLAARGNAVKVIGERVQMGGEWYLPIETLRMDALPSVEEAAGKPWLVHAMTTITPDLLSDGTYVCNPFHDFGGLRNMRYRVPLPIISKTGLAHIQEAHLVKLVGSPPSPYNPA